MHPLFGRPNAGGAIEALRPPDEETPRESSAAPECELRADHRRLAVPLDAPLLSRDNERYLFLRMNYLRFRAAALQRQIDRGDAPRGLTERVEAHLAEAVELRNRIAVANLRLVISIARTFASREHPLDELFSECQFSLIRAVELYDVEHGYSFSTYATHAVRNALGRALEQRTRYARRAAAAEPQALAAVADERPLPAQADRRQARQQALVARYLEVLPERERRIIAARFGLDGHDGEKTFREVGRLFGMSKERARVLANRALLRLQAKACIGEDEALD
jgi:RNA polymerase sigma factor (sigma-70 family)